MKFLHTPDIKSYRKLTTEELRDGFLVEGLFEEEQLSLTYTDVDRAIVGSAVPVKTPLFLPSHKELGSEFFAERRELGLINMGGEGIVVVDGVEYKMPIRSSLYIGVGSKSVEMTSVSSKKPAKYFICSFPAHRRCETRLITAEQANTVNLGSKEACNERTIFQSICPGVVDSCQLVMGFTQLKVGSVWNTFPPHTHRRRMEVYSYFDLDEEQAVMHLMGESKETRHLMMREGQAVVSPSWSIHSGVGTSNYTFIWAMGGENQTFDDMDHIKPSELA